MAKARSALAQIDDPQEKKLATEVTKKIEQPSPGCNCGPRLSQSPFFGFRYSVRPGLTGWAQVNHPYCSDIEDHYLKIEYDLYSLRDHGPTLYIMVIIRTLGALIFQPGQ